MNWWRLIYVAMLTSMVAVLSLFPALASTASTPRLGFIALLAVASCVGARVYQLEPASQVLVWGLWGCVIAAGLSALWSVNTTETLTQTAMLAALVTIIHGSLIRRWGTVDDVLDDLAAGFWLIAAAAVASLLAGHVLSVPGAMSGLGRLHGIFANPNMLAMVCTPALFIGIALLRRKVTLWRLAAVASIAAALLQAQSRTAAVAVAVAVVWLLFRVRSRVLLPVVYVAALVVTGWTTLVVTFRASLPVPDLAVLDRFTSPAAGGNLGFRDVIWRVSLETWRERPFFGTGYGTSQEVLADVLPRGDVTGATSVHSGFLQWLMETGAVGMIALAVPLVAVIRASLLTFRGSTAAPLGVVVFAGLVLQAGEAGLFGVGQPFPHLFWIAAAGVVVALDRPVEDLDPAASLRPRRRQKVDGEQVSAVARARARRDSHATRRSQPRPRPRAAAAR